METIEQLEKEIKDLSEVVPYWEGQSYRDGMRQLGELRAKLAQLKAQEAENGKPV